MCKWSEYGCSMNYERICFFSEDIAFLCENFWGPMEYLLKIKKKWHQHCDKREHVVLSLVSKIGQKQHWIDIPTQFSKRQMAYNNMQDELPVWCRVYDGLTLYWLTFY